MTDAEGLEAALDDLYHCILDADFNKLPRILEETERFAGRMAPLQDKLLADRLRNKAHRNGVCLLASARGLRAAQRRLADMVSASTQLSTYTSHGRRAEIATNPGAVARRL